MASKDRPSRLGSGLKQKKQSRVQRVVRRRLTLLPRRQLRQPGDG
jgi:hypothetical protein